MEINGGLVNITGQFLFFKTSKQPSHFPIHFLLNIFFKILNIDYNGRKPLDQDDSRLNLPCFYLNLYQIWKLKSKLTLQKSK